MSRQAERVLIGLLTEFESLEVIHREGFRPEIIPTEELVPVVEYALYYSATSGKAPTAMVINERFPDLLGDMDVTVDELPEESMEWALAELTFNHSRRMSNEILKSMARAVSGSDPETIYNVLAAHASDLSALVTDMAPQTSRVDLRERGQTIVDRHDLMAETGHQIRGLTFGLSEVDEHFGGIHPGEVAIFAAPPKAGKAQPLTSRVLTPGGWTTIGQLSEGDLIMGRRGVTSVTHLHPVSRMETYRVTTSDGGSTVCSAGHLWTIQTRDTRKTGTTMTVEVDELRQRVGRGQIVYLPLPDAVEHPEVDLPLDPYVLGALIGDGGLVSMSTTLTKQDRDFHEKVATLLDREVIWRGSKGKVLTSGLSGLKPVIRGLGLNVISAERFIPDVYMTASVEQRTELLRGLMDSDGERSKSKSGGGSNIYSTSSPRLSRDVQALVWSLGGMANIITGPTTHRDRHRVNIRLPISFGCPFTTERKVARWEDSQPTKCAGREPSRRVVSVEPEGVQDVRCITVAAEDGLYVTNDYIVTHNSIWLSYLALKDWQRGRSPVLVTLENSIEMTEMRIACQALHLDYRDLERGTLSPQDRGSLVEWVNDVLLTSDNPLHIIRPPEGQRTASALVQQAYALECDSLLVDQLTFVEPDRHRKDGSKAYEVAETIRRFKTSVSAGRRPIPLAMAHQVKREGVNAADKTGRLTMDAAADSSEVERGADMLFGLYASDDQRAANSMSLQALAVRRAQLRSYDLHWQIHMGIVGVQHALAEDDL